ncbi:hypothetical protein HNR39_001170 [Glaciimonas immobilis]|uniref:Uncharacterized protein n=1 Tax=Glaciimonas immobilis TaxID=728004 RepID=A0A840RNK3_9BURK|nr:hypothetical protein [Glaciimonas immobilis]
MRNYYTIRLQHSDNKTPFNQLSATLNGGFQLALRL